MIDFVLSSAFFFTCLIYLIVRENNYVHHVVREVIEEIAGKKARSTSALIALNEKIVLQRVS